MKALGERMVFARTREGEEGEGVGFTVERDFCLDAERKTEIADKHYDYVRQGFKGKANVPVGEARRL